MLSPFPVRCLFSWYGATGFVLLMLWGSLGRAEALSPEAEAIALAEALQPLIEQHQGQVGVCIQHLQRDVRYEYRAGEPMPTASLIKLPVMITAYQRAAAGELDFQQLVTYAAADKVPGSGILGQHFSPGLQLSLRDAVRLMIVYSDNIATNLVLKEVGLEPTNRLMEELGYPETRMHAFVYRGETSIAPERSAKFGLGSTTAAEMVSLLGKLHRGELISPEACTAMLEHLRACEDRARLGRFLPAEARIALKTGSVNAARTVAGIVESRGGPFAVCILTAENVDRSWTAENAAEVLSARLAQAAWDVFNRQASASSPVPDVLQVGAQGELVSDLQRTLNARLEPSPGLVVDGDFGPVTERAVKRLQQEAGLPETGQLDAATWLALGPLVATDQAPPPGEKQPADGDREFPYVTSAAWLVGDPATGEVAAGENLDTRRDFASTTKVMTALIVLRQLALQPELGEALLTVSPRADATPGSTAEVRAGEQLPVRELLYGLMLPSGNDAATAFAEYFGPQFRHPDDPAEIPPGDLFVREMNRLAAELGMSETTYANPHGLTHPDHKSTVRDQFRLATAALQQPGFRELVQTPYHAAIVTGPGGYQRTIVWRNTNRLLEIEGYAGVKTGTTNAAGACLISLGRRGEREAVVVVLGATSSDARYVDTRNLFQWYWSRQ